MARQFDIHEYLEDLHEYSNHAEVNIEIDDRVYLSTNHPDFDNSNPYISLELIWQFDNLTKFLDAYKVRSIKDLESITPYYLLEQYEKGNMEIYCHVDNKYFGGALRFRKNENGLFMREDESKEFHRLNIILGTTDDYVDYTTKFFLLQSRGIELMN